MRTLPPEVLEALRPLGTSLIADAIETFRIRMANEGFIRSGVVQDLTPSLDPMLGYAATARVRTVHPPMKGAAFTENSAWWRYLTTLPEPRVVVLHDFNHRPGLGAFLGELHTAVHKALNCVGVVTNGAVRDLAAIRASGFRCFAGHISMTRCYAHVVEFGIPVEIGGLLIQPGDLLYGDSNGVIAIPLDHAARIPVVAADIRAKKQKTIELCRSQDFSLEKLEALTKAFGFLVAESGAQLAPDLEKPSDA